MKDGRRRPPGPVLPVRRGHDGISGRLPDRPQPDRRAAGVGRLGAGLDRAGGHRDFSGTPAGLGGARDGLFPAGLADLLLQQSRSELPRELAAGRRGPDAGRIVAVAVAGVFVERTSAADREIDDSRYKNQRPNDNFFECLHFCSTSFILIGRCFFNII